MPRIEVAIRLRDEAQAEVHNIGRPAALVAFGDQFGKMSPNDYAEFAWLAHRAIVGKDGPSLDEWLETLDDLTAGPEVEQIKRELRGDLSPAELLDHAGVELLLELANEIVDVPDGVVVDGGVDACSKLQLLVVQAERELEERRQKELDVQRAIEAALQLSQLEPAELEAMDPDEVKRLRELASQAPAGVVDALNERHPTTPAPATGGGGE